MHQRRGLPFKRTILILIELLVVISTSMIRASENGLTQSELKAKYGQGGANIWANLHLYPIC